MGEMEQHGYVRMSDPAASYAFYVHPRGFALLNLRWLAEVIEQYEASAQRLGDVPTEEGRLALLRMVVGHVDDDRLAWFMRQGHDEGDRVIG